MDILLMDIKNFLKKLENGQLDIEAGQWELHKDIANMKRSVEELKKVKEDVEVMRKNNAEQMGLIKNLETKLEIFNKNYQDDKPVTISHSSIEYEKVYRRPTEGLQKPKGYKKRKCHLVRSEEIIEITSELSQKKSSIDNEDTASRTEGSACEKKVADENEQGSEDNSLPPVHPVCIPSTAQNPKPRHQSHAPNNAILQRYLKDSAKYRDRQESCSTDLESRPSGCLVSKDAEYNNLWDEYSSRAPQNRSYENRDDTSGNYSLESVKTTESVLPKRICCPKIAKKFNVKSDFPKHDKRSRGCSKVVFYCKLCGKGFSRKNMLRAHETNHGESKRKVEGYKCSYCDKICSTPEKLTQHLKNCRIIMRYHYKRR